MLFKKIVALALVLAVVLVASPAYAKGGSGGGGSSFVFSNTTSGPCNLEWGDIATNPDGSMEFSYPLTNPLYTGGVAVDIVIKGASISAKSICLDAGWTVNSFTTKTGGFEVKFDYNGVRAIGMTFVGGKTKITNN